MTSLRSICFTAATLAILGSACSSDSSGPSRTGGSLGTGGASGPAGTGGAPGSSGAKGSGGSPGQGGTIDSGGATLPGSGGASATGGRSGAGTGGTTLPGTSAASVAGGRTGAGTGGTTLPGTSGASVTGGRTGAGTGGATLPGTSGASVTGGRTGVGTGGAGTGGQQGSGGAGVGGASIATAGSTRAGSGGSGGSGAGASAGSGGSSAGSGAGGVPQSAGCGKTATLKNGTINITVDGATRKYILRVPSDYDSTHAYRLVFAFAESGASAQSVADRSYFTMATQDSKNTIFAAPDAANGAGSWSKTDVQLTDAILAQLEADLCIDKTRIFATGFSFGGAMSIALACTRADVFRAVAFFSGADLTGSCPTTLTKPIAYWASQASQDSSGTPTPTSGRTIQALAAAVNGCTADPNAINFPAAGQPHTCTNYKNCSEGHPTIYCVFDGAHGWEPKDPGQSTSWAAKEAWAFITQF